MSYSPQGKRQTKSFTEAVEVWIDKATAYARNNGFDERDMSEETLQVGEALSKSNASVTASAWAAWMRDSTVKAYPERVVVYSPSELFHRYASQEFESVLAKFYGKPVNFQVSKFV